MIRGPEYGQFHMFEVISRCGENHEHDHHIAPSRAAPLNKERLETLNISRYPGYVTRMSVLIHELTTVREEAQGESKQVSEGKSNAYEPELASSKLVTDGGDPAPDCISRRSRASSAARVLYELSTSR